MSVEVSAGNAHVKRLPEATVVDEIQPTKQRIDRPQHRPDELHGDKDDHYDDCRAERCERGIIPRFPTKASNLRST